MFCMISAASLIFLDRELLLMETASSSSVRILYNAVDFLSFLLFQNNSNPKSQQRVREMGLHLLIPALKTLPQLGCYRKTVHNQPCLTILVILATLNEKMKRKKSKSFQVRYQMSSVNYIYTYLSSTLL